MADVELLPLPRWMETYRIPGDDFHNSPDQYLSERMQSYARANLAPLQAENERLRAEVETWKTFARGKDGLWQESVRRAERLAEALRKLEEREQSDEALLRQALEALELRCGTHADERKKLIPALRERLGEEGRDDLSQGDQP